MERYPVAGFEAAEGPQESGELIDPVEQLLVGDVQNGLVLGLRHEVECRLVLVFGKVPIEAIVAGVDASSDEPAPERRLAGIEDLLPGFVPIEKIGVFLETFRKMSFIEPLENLPIR